MIHNQKSLSEIITKSLGSSLQSITRIRKYLCRTLVFLCQEYCWFGAFWATHYKYSHNLSIVSLGSKHCLVGCNYHPLRRVGQYNWIYLSILLTQECGQGHTFYYQNSKIKYNMKKSLGLVFSCIITYHILIIDTNHVKDTLNVFPINFPISPTPKMPILISFSPRWFVTCI